MAWERVYRDTLKLLHNWPDPPLGIDYREVADEEVLCYTKNFERAEGWCVVGDATSRLRGESFELPKGLFRNRFRYADDAGDDDEDAADSQSGHQAERDQPEEDGAEEDVLQALADEDAGRPSALGFLLGNKTQDQPYHLLMVAVATLIENRLRRIALAHGDFDVDQAREACIELQRIFNERFEPPILVEPQRIRARVPGIDAEALSEQHTAPPASPALSLFLDLIKERPDYRLSDELENEAPGCADANRLSEDAHKFFSVLGARMAALSEQANAQPTERTAILSSIAKRTRRQHICLTEMAWEQIERADPETLCFFHQLSGLDASRLEVKQALVAAFESPAVRDIVMTARAGHPPRQSGQATSP